MQNASKIFQVNFALVICTNPTSIKIHDSFQAFQDYLNMKYK